MHSALNSSLRRAARRGLERVLNLPPVRVWLSRRALDAWNRADSVAFVCLGNICRSPFAEAVARQRAPGRTLLSAGSLPKTGRRSPAQAVRSASARDIDLRPHRSRVFSPKLAASAGAIFVFDFHNLRRVLTEHPRALRRVHPLGALTSGGPLFISDPYGGDAATFDETFEQIAAAIPATDQRLAKRPQYRSRRFTPERHGPPSPERTAAAGR
jgi:protein-tyrosine phosphatase